VRFQYEVSFHLDETLYIIPKLPGIKNSFSFPKLCPEIKKMADEQLFLPWCEMEIVK